MIKRGVSGIILYSIHCNFQWQLGGRCSTKRADLTLATAPFAAGIGQTHHQVSSLAVSLAQGFKDFLWEEGTGLSGKHTIPTLSWCEARISVSLKETFYCWGLSQNLSRIVLLCGEGIIRNSCKSKTVWIVMVTGDWWFMNGLHIYKHTIL